MIRYDKNNIGITTQRISKSVPYYYALFGANGLSPIYPAGAINASALANAANTANILYAIPFINAPRETNLIGVQITIQTASAGNSGIIGIYENTGHATLYPSGLVFKCSPFNLNSTGARIGDANLILEPGKVYWSVYNASVATSIRNTPVAAISPMLGFDESFFPLANMGYRAPYTFNSTLPAIFPTGATPLSNVNTAVGVATVGLRFGY
jgi:hypothetical protein